MFLYPYILPAVVLLSACADDLRSKKIHNVLILALLLSLFICILLFEGMWGLVPAIIRLFLALSIAIPLTLLKVMGGGDMKLYAVLGFSLTMAPDPAPVSLLSALAVSNSYAVVMTLICGLMWGGALGLIKTCLDGKAGLMYSNLIGLFKFKKPVEEHLNYFPFSISLLLGWLSAFYFV